MPQFSGSGFPVGLGTRASRKRGRTLPATLARLLMQAHGSSQVSPQSAKTGAEAAVCFAGVAQLVEHLFCKQVVRGSSPRASSGSTLSESCPSGQREQAVNLPAYAYAGSNPALSTAGRLRRAAVSISFLGELSSPSTEVNSAEPPPQVSGPQPRNNGL